MEEYLSDITRRYKKAKVSFCKIEKVSIFALENRNLIVDKNT